MQFALNVIFFIEILCKKYGRVDFISLLHNIIVKEKIFY